MNWDLVEGDLKENFKCNICSLIINEPRECKICGELYCKLCNINSKCCNNELTELNPLLKRLYNNLLIKCNICNKKSNISEYYKTHINCKNPSNCANYEICKERSNNNSIYCSDVCYKYTELLEKGVNSKNYYDIIINNN